MRVCNGLGNIFIPPQNDAYSLDKNAFNPAKERIAYSLEYLSAANIAARIKTADAAKKLGEDAHL